MRRERIRARRAGELIVGRSAKPNFRPARNQTHSPAWSERYTPCSSDGSLIAFKSDRDGIHRLIAIDRDGKKFRHSLTRRRPCWPAAIAASRPTATARTSQVRWRPLVAAIQAINSNAVQVALPARGRVEISCD